MSNYELLTNHNYFQSIDLTMPVDVVLACTLCDAQCTSKISHDKKPNETRTRLILFLCAIVKMMQSTNASKV